MLAAERYDGAEPVNLGAGREISIHDLVHDDRPADRLHAGASCGTAPSPTGSRGGCSRRRARRQAFGFVATTPFEEGLRRTVEWYRQSLGAGRAAGRPTRA